MALKPDRTTKNKFWSSSRHLVFRLLCLLALCVPFHLQQQVFKHMLFASPAGLFVPLFVEDHKASCPCNVDRADQVRTCTPYATYYLEISSLEVQCIAVCNCFWPGLAVWMQDGGNGEPFGRDRQRFGQGKCVCMCMCVCDEIAIECQISRLHRCTGKCVLLRL
jgi:hypothetical protein